MTGMPWRYIVTLALMGLALVGGVVAGRMAGEPLAASLETIDRKIGDWDFASDIPLSADVLQALRPTSVLSRIYRRGSTKAALLIVYYANQRAGESLHSPKNCLPGSGWEVWDYSTVGVPVAGRTITVNKYGVHKGAARMMVLYWYQSRKRIFASEYMGKLFMMRDAVLDGSASGSLVRITSPDNPDALADAVNFAALLIPKVQTCLGR
jgi:EpsI family protein